MRIQTTCRIDAAHQSGVASRVVWNAVNEDFAKELIQATGEKNEEETDVKLPGDSDIDNTSLEAAKESYAALRQEVADISADARELLRTEVESRNISGMDEDTILEHAEIDQVREIAANYNRRHELIASLDLAHVERAPTLQWIEEFKQLDQWEKLRYTVIGAMATSAAIKTIEQAAHDMFGVGILAETAVPAVQDALSAAIWHTRSKHGPEALSSLVQREIPPELLATVTQPLQPLIDVLKKLGVDEHSATSGLQGIDTDTLQRGMRRLAQVDPAFVQSGKITGTCIEFLFRNPHAISAMVGVLAWTEELPTGNTDKPYESTRSAMLRMASAMGLSISSADEQQVFVDIRNGTTDAIPERIDALRSFHESLQEMSNSLPVSPDTLRQAAEHLGLAQDGTLDLHALTDANTLHTARKTIQQVVSELETWKSNIQAKLTDIQPTLTAYNITLPPVDQLMHMMRGNTELDIAQLLENPGSIPTLGQDKIEALETSFRTLEANLQTQIDTANETLGTYGAKLPAAPALFAQMRGSEAIDIAHLLQNPETLETHGLAELAEGIEHIHTSMRQLEEAMIHQISTQGLTLEKDGKPIQIERAKLEEKLPAIRAQLLPLVSEFAQAEGMMHAPLVTANGTLDLAAAHTLSTHETFTQSTGFWGQVMNADGSINTAKYAAEVGKKTPASQAALGLVERMGNFLLQANPTEGSALAKTQDALGDLVPLDVKLSMMASQFQDTMQELMNGDLSSLEGIMAAFGGLMAQLEKLGEMFMKYKGDFLASFEAPIRSLAGTAAQIGLVDAEIIKNIRETVESDRTRVLLQCGLSQVDVDQFLGSGITMGELMATQGMEPDKARAQILENAPAAQKANRTFGDSTDLPRLAGMVAKADIYTADAAKDIPAAEFIKTHEAVLHAQVATTVETETSGEETGTNEGSETKKAKSEEGAEAAEDTEDAGNQEVTTAKETSEDPTVAMQTTPKPNETD